jgi:hypothetical protein
VRLVVSLAIVLAVLVAGCGGAAEDTGTAAGSKLTAQTERVREIQAQSNRLAEEGEWAERSAEKAALAGEANRQRNAEILATVDARKLKALKREAEAILAEAREDHAP